MRFSPLSPRRWVGLVACCGLVAGCGEKPAIGPPPGKFDASLAGPNRRFKGKEEEYKKAIGKDGRLLLKQGMKKPPPPPAPPKS